ncbi:hypothetical protein CLIB1423_08S04764 [[Candida] railenensis]|uniref:Uncharacterized protein n=1 Tax=[Candida] railenensis TaxID=45579 RepID=A0A9P0QQY2_9ASCO|nr:hypothetical protein CLIB1423_08S04764 [[Candida] railenensis]
MDRLESKSSSLIQTANNTSTLLSHVTKLHSSIALADSTIGTLNETIATNYTYLHKIDQLHEKSFYLESSLSSNDVITNQTTWNNLYNEYQFIVDQFKQSTDKIRIRGTTLGENGIEPKEEENNNNKKMKRSTPLEHQLPALQPPSEERTLSNSISVSDIRLKPIRCREKKMYKKKSRYRLSQIYNINPLASSPILEVPGSDMEFDNSSFVRTQPNVISNTQTEEEETEGDRTSSTDNGYKEASTLCTSPEILFPPLSISSLRARSNSVPEISFHTASGENAVSGLNIFSSEGIMKQSNILNEFSENEETLRMNRLKHFVSMSNVFHRNGAGPHIQEQGPQKAKETIEEEGSPFDINFNKTPIFTPICLENNDLDHLDIDACSDYSYYSPEKLEEDDFEKYLRRSRVDLADAFPNTIKRSKSHDSVFSNHITTPKWIFHNPIDNTASTQIAGPTIKISDDYIYYRGNEDKRGKKVSDKTANLLNEVISKNSEPNVEKDIPTTPSKIPNSNFSLFSPFKTTSANMSSGPSLSKSFSESIMSLVNSDKKKPLPTSTTTTAIAPMVPEFTPTKSSLSSTKPIIINNSSQLQRIPPARRERTDGSHSKLTIGPNKTAIFNHGEQSYFKRPLQSKVSHNSLHEALSFSMLQ